MLRVSCVFMTDLLCDWVSSFISEHILAYTYKLSDSVDSADKMEYTAEFRGAQGVMARCLQDSDAGLAFDSTPHYASTLSHAVSLKGGLQCHSNWPEWRERRGNTVCCLAVEHSWTTLRWASDLSCIVWPHCLTTLFSRAVCLWMEDSGCKKCDPLYWVRYLAALVRLVLLQ